MLVKHLLEALGNLEPDVRIVTADGRAPVVRFETHWRVEWHTGVGSARQTHLDYHSREIGARTQVSQLRALGCSFLTVDPVFSVVFA
jgi:hypothetical protein